MAGFDRASFPYHIDLLDLHAADPVRFPFLLESVAHHPQQGRYDILFADPEEELRFQPGTFLETLGDTFAAAAKPLPKSPPPFGSGWFLFLSYELAGEIEPHLRLPAWVDGPTGFAVRCRSAVIRDHLSETAWIICEGMGQGSARAMRQNLLALSLAHPVSTPGGLVVPGSLSEDEPNEYLAAVRQALGHIRAGDIFQANLSRLWTAELRDHAGPADVYRRLRATNPAPFSALIQWQGLSLVSSSPERLLQVRDRWASTRPIAGTRPRSMNSRDDLSLSNELFSSDKERAEHVMLIDLERNDLGRVCEAGSVAVSEFMTHEKYRHVHHIVSAVGGRLRDNVTPIEAISALFPGGTITGCPKVRCMEIIADLEHQARGAYTGSLGYLNLDGSLDLNILIRTMVIVDKRVSFRAGGGTVADSIAEHELSETRAKAKGLVMALEGN
jgi:anthranilate synthase component 1